MPSTVPPSSPPVPSHAWSSESSPRTSQLSSPQLPYRAVQQPPSQSQDDPISATFPLDPPDALPAEFLAALNDDIESGSEDESIQWGDEQVAEAENNQLFLDQDLDSDDESDDESDEKSDDESDDESSASSKASEQNQGPVKVDMIATCRTIYAREKLVRILNGEVVVPKQRWGIDRILTTLTYHRKDKRLSSSYRKFKKFAFSTLLRESDKSSAGNISVFEDLNINQLGLAKDDPRFDEFLYIWWGDLKTEVQMLSMQNYGIGMDRAYDRYQHIFPGLALWHLRFNYLKMIWEVFYPGGWASERSTLQWAAEHWHRDKTTRPTDFHSLEDLTNHSYRARIIAMLKPWVHQQINAFNSIILKFWVIGFQSFPLVSGRRQ